MTLIWRTCKFAQFTERIQTSHITNTGYLSFLGNVKNWKIPAHNLFTSVHPLTTFKLKRLTYNPDRLKAIQDIYQFPSFLNESDPRSDVHYLGSSENKA